MLLSINASKDAMQSIQHAAKFLKISIRVINIKCFQIKASNTSVVVIANFA